MGGLILAKLGWATNSHLVLAPLFLSAVVVWRKSWLAALALTLLALNLGLWRGQAIIRSYQPLFKVYEQKVTLTGVVADDAALADRFQTEFHINKLSLEQNGDFQPVGGRVQVRGFVNDGKVNRADVVAVTGKLRPALGNRQGQISFGEITIFGKKDSPIESIRRRFLAGVHSALPDPQGSLGLGFLIGLRNLLPDQLTDQLSRTGLTHIVAVSGFNLTIIVRFGRRLFAKYSKYWATAVPVGLMAVFLAFTGLSPSIFRAVIVSGLALTAWYYGRPIKPMILILVAASVTAGINPSYVWYDIGWHLSFLAFFGVLVIAPALSARIYKKRHPGWLTQIIIETTSAQLMTMPLIIFIFGQAAIVSPLANLIILPLIPFAMLVTLLAGLGGMFATNLVGWLAWPASFVLTFMVKAVEKIAALPWASIELRMNVWQLVLIYGIILGTFLVMRRAVRNYIDPNRSVIE